MRVKDIMHKGAIWVSPEAWVSDIAKTMREQAIGAVLVGEDDQLVGMVTDRDITCRAFVEGHDIAKLTARDVMSSPIHYCHADDQVQRAAELMETNNVRRLPVIDEHKRMVGILSLDDLAAKAPRTLSARVLSTVAKHHA